MVLAEQKHRLHLKTWRTMQIYTCTSCLRGFEKFPCRKVETKIEKLLVARLEEIEMIATVKKICRLFFIWYVLFSQYRSRGFLENFHFFFRIYGYICTCSSRAEDEMSKCCSLENDHVVCINKIYKLRRPIGEIILRGD